MQKTNKKHDTSSNNHAHPHILVARSFFFSPIRKTHHKTNGFIPHTAAGVSCTTHVAGLADTHLDGLIVSDGTQALLTPLPCIPPADLIPPPPPPWLIGIGEGVFIWKCAAAWARGVFGATAKPKPMGAPKLAPFNDGPAAE